MSKDADLVGKAAHKLLQVQHGLHNAACSDLMLVATALSGEAEYSIADRNDALAKLSALAHAGGDAGLLMPMMREPICKTILQNLAARNMSAQPVQDFCHTAVPSLLH